METEEPTTSADWIAAISAADTVTNLNRLRVRIGRAEVTDKAVIDAWHARSSALSGTSAVAAKSAPEPATPVADDEIIDAVVVEDGAAPMSGAQAWQAALTLAGTRGWNRQHLADRFLAQYNLDYRAEAVTNEMLVEFLGLIQSGEIA